MEPPGVGGYLLPSTYRPGPGGGWLMVDYTCNTRVEDGATKRKLTITVDEEVYEGLRRVVGQRHISRFLEALARPHVVLTDMDAAYAAMAADEAREKDALEWAEATVGDIPDSEGDSDESG
jgi:predicted CopG family antitoxin